MKQGAHMHHASMHIQVNLKPLFSRFLEALILSLFCYCPLAPRYWLRVIQAKRRNGHPKQHYYPEAQLLFSPGPDHV